MKVSELTGPALDWLVAKCETPSGRDSADHWLRDYKVGFGTWYSTNWSQGGPIIEREEIAVIPLTDGWEAHFEPSDERHSVELVCVQSGSTPLIAAMRCYVASKLGEEIEIPKELK